MTVKELIEELKEHKQDLPVTVVCKGECRDILQIKDKLTLNGKGFTVSLIIVTD